MTAASILITVCEPGICRSVIAPTGAVPNPRVTVKVTTPEVDLPAPRPQPAIATAAAIAIAVTAAPRLMANRAVTGGRGSLDLEQQLLSRVQLDVADP